MSIRFHNSTYVIENTNGHFWNGFAWAPGIHNAMSFRDGREATSHIFKLLREEL